MRELKQVTEHDEAELHRYIDELKSLFLISAPRLISKEARFSVQSTTRALILENVSKLKIDVIGIQQRCARLRSKTKGIARSGTKRTISSIITQSKALLRGNRFDDAIETVSVGLKKFPSDPELLFSMAKCHLENVPPNYPMARNNFLKAFRLGVGRYQLFAAWYECEIESKNPSAAVEVASHAISGGLADRVEWFLKRAAALRAVSLERDAQSDYDAAINNLRLCNADLRAALPLCKSNQAEEIQVGLKVVGQLVWYWSEKRAQDIPSWLRAFDVLKESVWPQSESHQVAENMLTCIEKMTDLISRSGQSTDRQANLLNQLYEHLIIFISNNRGTHNE